MTSDTNILGRSRLPLAALFARYSYAIAAFDQLSLSIFAFGLNLCLLRALSATDYGIVSLWMSLALFAGTAQAALVNKPLSIYPPAAEPAAARRLDSAIATVNLLTIVAAAIIAGGANLAAEGEWAPQDALTMIAIPLFVAAGMYREYYRSTAFSRHDMALLLWVDGPYLAVTTLCLSAMMVWPQRFADLAAALLAMSLGCLVSQLCVRLRGAAAGRRLFEKGWIKTYRQITGEVMWSLVGAVANHVQSRSYVYIATSLVGVASLAAINAIGLLFRPVSVLVNAWGQSALPHLSAALAQGRVAEFDRMMARALIAATLASIGAGVVLWLGWDPIQHYLLAGKYPDGDQLLLAWAAASGASVLRYLGSTGLMAARQFRFLANSQILCGALAAAATVGFILWGGYADAMWGIALGEAACFVWIMLRLRAERRRAAMQSVLPG